MKVPRSIAVDLDGIGHLLSDNMFVVPIYQRSYAWGEDEVKELLQDLTTAFAERKKEREYFLGALVIAYSKRDRPEVVDGQQRLATVSMLIAAIRDFLIAQGDEETADIIERRYLLSRHMRTLEIIPRLLLNETDQQFFVECILTRPDVRREVKKQRASHERIASAFNAITFHIETIAELHSRARDHLLDWIAYLHEQVKVIRVQVPEHSDAFTIFETLNHRGVDLSETDLVKNHIFHLAEDRLSIAKEEWTSVFESLGWADESDRSVEFLRHFWSSKDGLTRRRELYDRIKNRVHTSRGAVAFAKEAALSAPIYAAMLDLDHPAWSELGLKCRSAVHVLNLLGMVRMRPLILSILECWAGRERERGIRLLQGWAVRFLVVGGLGAGTVEDGFAKWATSIRNKEILTAASLLETAKEIIPGDLAFKAAFAEMSIPKAKIARYIILAMDCYRRGQDVQEADLEGTKLEHVMSLKASPDETDPELAAYYARRLGNVVLIEVGNTAMAKARTADQRNAAFRHSPYPSTVEVAVHDWGPDEIEARQAEMAIQAVDVWPLRIQ